MGSGLRVKGLDIVKSGTSLFPAASFHVMANELLVVMGPSGCGKSTLLAAIAGNLSAEFELHGQIELAGVKLNNVLIEHRNIGMQFQDDLLFPHMNVEGNLLFAIKRGERKERKRRVLEALEKAGLSGFEKRDVSRLSGGQRARISLLRTLLAEPKLLLLDEPFSRLDQVLRSDFRHFVYQSITHMNIPAILVTHDLQDSPNSQYYDLQQGEMKQC